VLATVDLNTRRTAARLLTALRQLHLLKIRNVI
jgi:hypothetical protein